MTATFELKNASSVTPILTLNNVNLVGRAGSNPETKYFESGSVKTTVTMAVKRQGRKSDPDWFTLEFWGNVAEIAANYLNKGDQFGITGYLKIETWLDENLGCSRSRPVIKVNSLYLLGGGSTRSNNIETLAEEF